MMWEYSEAGQGRPLILLHGIGMSHAAWKPVMPLLSEKRRVIAFDVAGFGDTPPLPEGTAPTVTNLVGALAETLLAMGIKLPVDIAGNSLGGYMALEAAKQGVARSIVALAPAGLWKDHPSFYVKYVFLALRSGAKNFPSIAKAALRIPFMREAILAVPISLGCRHMPADDAIRAMEDFAKSRVFWETFKYAQSFTDGKSISIPVTIVYGTRDWVLPRSSQRREGVPVHARWIHPEGWGHVPMWYDPAGVARLILEGTN